MEQSFPVFEGRNMLTVKIDNTQPIDLIDLTKSLTALAQEFRDFTDEGQPDVQDIKLYIKELRSGSVIADLIPIAQQADWLLDHKDLLGAFISNFSDLANYFLTGKTPPKALPTQEQAKRLAQIVEPVAKDAGGQFNMQISDQAKVEIHQHFYLGYRDANALQNGVRRYLGPDLQAVEIRRDLLLTLEQVKNVASSKTGDRAIIEALWPRPVKLQFLNDEAKSQVLNLEDNPLQKVFLVDVEVHAIGGKPVLYRIIEVKDDLEKPGL